MRYSTPRLWVSVWPFRGGGIAGCGGFVEEEEEEEKEEEEGFVDDGESCEGTGDVDGEGASILRLTVGVNMGELESSGFSAVESSVVLSFFILGV